MAIMTIVAVVAIAREIRLLDHDPFNRDGRTTFGRTLEAQVLQPAPAGNDLDRATGDDLPAAPAEAFFVDRVPLMKDVAGTERRQLSGR